MFNKGLRQDVEDLRYHVDQLSRDVGVLRRMIEKDREKYLDDLLGYDMYPKKSPISNGLIAPGDYVAEIVLVEDYISKKVMEGMGSNPTVRIKLAIQDRNLWEYLLTTTQTHNIVKKVLTARMGKKVNVTVTVKIYGNERINRVKSDWLEDVPDDN